MDKHDKTEDRIGLEKEISEIRGQAPGVVFKKKKSERRQIQFIYLFFFMY